MDLAEWYEAGRWAALLDLIDMLPSACRLNEAITNDPDAAEYLASVRLEKDGEGEQWAPSVSEFKLEHHMLRQLIASVDLLVAITSKVNGGQPGEIKPFPAPRTAIDKAIQRMEREWATDVAGQFGFDASDF